MLSSGSFCESDDRIAGQPAGRRLPGRLLGPAALMQEQPAAEQRHHEEGHHPDEQRPQASIGPLLGGRSCRQVLLLGLPAGDRAVDERLLGGGEVGRDGRHPFLDGAQPCPLVQLGAVTTGSLPFGGGGGQMAKDPLALAVLVQPGAQAGPRPAEGFVRDLDAVGVGREEPSVEQRVQHLVVAVVPDQVAVGESGGVTGAPASDSDTSRSNSERVIRRPSGDRRSRTRSAVAATAPVHAPARLVAGHGQHPIIPVHPGLGQRVGQQRQGPGLAFDVAEDHVDESGFEPQAGSGGRDR